MIYQLLTFTPLFSWRRVESVGSANRELGIGLLRHLYYFTTYMADGYMVQKEDLVTWTMTNEPNISDFTFIWRINRVL